MTPLDRLLRYMDAVHLIHAVDPLEYQRRFLRGLQVIASLPKDVVIGRVRSKPSNVRQLRKVAR